MGKKSRAESMRHYYNMKQTTKITNMLKSIHSYNQTDHRLEYSRDNWENIHSYDQKESQTGILRSKLKCPTLLNYRRTGVD